MSANMLRAAATAALLSLAVLAPAAQAQVAGTEDIGTVTVRARVVAVNHRERTLTLRGPDGRSVTLVAGPDVRNFDQIKRGNDVVAHYRESVAFVLSRPGEAVPDNSVAVGGARAPEGAMPAGAVARRITITGLVVGVDTTAHTISLVDPNGGGVRTIDVVDPQRQQQLTQVKVGDKLTVVFTQALALSVEPAH
jgi:type 1 fimbria pilin